MNKLQANIKKHGGSQEHNMEQKNQCEKERDMGKVLKKVRKGGNASGVWGSIPEEKSQQVQRC